MGVVIKKRSLHLSHIEYTSLKIGEKGIKNTLENSLKGGKDRGTTLFCSALTVRSLTKSNDFLRMITDASGPA